MKSPFAYFGGKSRLAAWIASLLPAHSIYVEPFAGSAAVLFAKEPSTREVINDVDGGVVHFLRTLREQPDELARACALTPFSRYGRRGAVIYADPPYLASTRTLGRRPSGDYLHEFATDDQHRQLAEALHATPAAVLLSGYHSGLYDDLYDGWTVIERTVPLHSSNGTSGVRNARRVEVIWSNRPIGNGRLDFTAAGVV